GGVDGGETLFPVAVVRTRAGEGRAVSERRRWTGGRDVGGPAGCCCRGGDGLEGARVKDLSRAGRTDELDELCWVETGCGCGTTASAVEGLAGSGGTRGIAFLDVPLIVLGLGGGTGPGIGGWG
ncbi:hypothetical protein DACRYDRAFT_97162, partial [Dacryopinax primogenitus]